MRKRALTAAVFLVFAGSDAAVSDDDCHLAMNQWQPRDAVQKMAEARGWTIRRIRADDGCYQIKGTDENGRDIKVKVDPGSLEIVKMKRDGLNDDDENGADQPRAAPTSPSNGLFTNKGAPKAKVK
ncbi:PepSY domain-containing protein [Mesorhizobium sp. Root552]|jgi:hypothetical protein|uniref:PepSY domain-containing protein n=1 Tax=Mesorhizobium sp. Root552 TaxID=1736555 RepID=UPI0009E94F09|nr:PepSY domain-containing protein [Mesorhizobium sp. Root552]